MANGITFSGLASGLDTGSIITQLVAIERQPITNLEDQKSDLNLQKTKIQSIVSGIKALETAAEKLSKADDVSLISATSSETDVLGVAVTGRAPTGSFSVEVTALARQDKSYSAAFGSGALGFADDDTLTLTIDGALTSIALDASDDLEDVAAKINSSGAAARATVVGDGEGGGALLITSDETGADQAITFGGSGASLLAMTNHQAASDASVTVDGVVTVTSADNSIEGVIQGVTLNLEELGTSTVTIERDNEAFKALIDDFVEAYNKVIGDVSKEFAWSGEARTKGNLSGDSSLRAAQRTLQNAVIQTVSGLTGEYTTLSSIGIHTDRTGKLTVDDSELEEALAQDPDAVTDLFASNADSGTRGVAYRLVNAEAGQDLSLIETLIDSHAGTLSVRVDGINERMESIDANIERMETRVEAYEDRLRREFMAMESAMSQLQSQMGYLSGLSGYGS